MSIDYMWILMRAAVATVVVVGFFVVFQDCLVFPELWSYPTRYFVPPQEPTVGVRHVLTSPDGTKFEVFELQPPELPAKGVAVVFHGNGETCRTFVGVQEWLKSLGIASYSVEYRGYGKSQGWPSEKGLYMDGETAWDFVRRRESVPVSKIIILAHSVGTGFAASLAAKKSPGALILLSAYSSLKARATEEPVLGKLAALFFHYNVPTREYVASLTNTCLVIAHGEKDTIMPFHHGQEVAAAYRGTQLITIFSPMAGHNDILSSEQGRISEAILSCLAVP